MKKMQKGIREALNQQTIKEILSNKNNKSLQAICKNHSDLSNKAYYAFYNKSRDDFNSDNLQNLINKIGEEYNIKTHLWDLLIKKPLSDSQIAKKLSKIYFNQGCIRGEGLLNDPQGQRLIYVLKKKNSCEKLNLKNNSKNNLLFYMQKENQGFKLLDVSYTESESYKTLANMAEDEVKILFTIAKYLDPEFKELSELKTYFKEPLKKVSTKYSLKEFSKDPKNTSLENFLQADIRVFSGNEETLVEVKNYGSVRNTRINELIEKIKGNLFWYLNLKHSLKHIIK